MEHPVGRAGIDRSWSEDTPICHRRSDCRPGLFTKSYSAMGWLREMHPRRKSRCAGPTLLRELSQVPSEVRSLSWPRRLDFALFVAKPAFPAWGPARIGNGGRGTVRPKSANTGIARLRPRGPKCANQNGARAVPRSLAGRLWKSSRWVHPTDSWGEAL